MHQKTPDKLLHTQGHHFFLIVVLAVLISEGDPAIGDGQDAPVADGDAMGVPAEVFEYLGRAPHRGFGIDHPTRFIQAVEQ